jgi:hypothetical protein
MRSLPPELCYDDFNGPGTLRYCFSMLSSDYIIGLLGHATASSRALMIEYFANISIYFETRSPLINSFADLHSPRLISLSRYADTARLDFDWMFLNQRDYTHFANFSRSIQRQFNTYFLSRAAAPRKA